MRCYVCGQLGKPSGPVFYGPKRNIMFLRYRCVNKTCRFEYTRANLDDEHDGKVAWAMPSWTIPVLQAGKEQIPVWKLSKPEEK